MIRSLDLQDIPPDGPRLAGLFTLPFHYTAEGISLDWKVSVVGNSVFRYGLLMRSPGDIEFERLEKQCWSYLRNVETAINHFFVTNVSHIIDPIFRI
jgi:hypothetical protein